MASLTGTVRSGKSGRPRCELQPEDEKRVHANAALFRDSRAGRLLAKAWKTTQASRSRRAVMRERWPAPHAGGRSRHVLLTDARFSQLHLQEQRNKRIHDREKVL
jgi:hypothetical protein